MNEVLRDKGNSDASARSSKGGSREAFKTIPHAGGNDFPGFGC